MNVVSFCITLLIPDYIESVSSYFALNHHLSDKIWSTGSVMLFNIYHSGNLTNLGNKVLSDLKERKILYHSVIITNNFGEAVVGRENYSFTAAKPVPEPKKQKLPTLSKIKPSHLKLVKDDDIIEPDGGN